MKATVAKAILFGALTVIALGAPLSRSGVKDGDFRCGIAESDSSRHRRAATGYQNKLWANAVVPFVLADSFEGQRVMTRCKVATSRWEAWLLHALYVNA